MFCRLVRQVLILPQSHVLHCDTFLNALNWIPEEYIDVTLLLCQTKVDDLLFSPCLGNISETGLDGFSFKSCALTQKQTCFAAIGKAVFQHYALSALCLAVEKWVGMFQGIRGRAF